MRARENYTTLVAIAFCLTLAIIIAFQIYIIREPARIQADVQHELHSTVKAGEYLFGENCAACHGVSGEGAVGPALNSRQLLAMASDELLFNIVRTGIPSTIMPAWSQSFGGPLTDQEINQLVAFIRAWEKDAPEPVTIVNLPDPARGAAIFAFTCAVCHGENGKGSLTAPALNDTARLASLDNNWYRQTISYGRPAKGMPTWGTVLSPGQIDDLVALISAWREGRDVLAEISMNRLLTQALFSIRQFDREDTLFFLEFARQKADSDMAGRIQVVIRLVDENRLFEGEAALISLLPPEEMGRALFESNCAACHGLDASGGLGPNLNNNAFVNSQSDSDLIQFILNGRPGTAMNGFQGILYEDDLVNLIKLLRIWQSP